MAPFGYHEDHLLHIAHLKKFLQEEGYFRLQRWNLVKYVKDLYCYILMKERGHEVNGMPLKQSGQNIDTFLPLLRVLLQDEPDDAPADCKEIPPDMYLVNMLVYIFE